jgi:F-type H+-transporting ATPase subunit b
MQELIQTFGLDLELLFIQMVNFGLVLLVLWYFLYRPVMNMVDERQKKIEKGVNDAEKAKEERKNADEEKSSILAKANEEAERIVAEGKDHAGKQKESIVEDAQKKRDEILEQAQSRGEETKREFLRESQEEVARMSVLGAERILREKLDKEEAEEEAKGERKAQVN